MRASALTVMAILFNISSVFYAKDPMSTPKYPETLRQGRADCGYDEFLYAQLGEEANGMQLSVLSALARQNVDPWEIAQRLTSLPREPAILFLTPLLARTPAGLAAPEDTAARLIAMLHSQRAPAAKAGIFNTEQNGAPPDAAIDKMWLIVAFALYMLFSQLLFVGLTPGEITGKPTSPAASAPAPTAVTTLPAH
jgi:hypothetical protein